MNLFQPKWKSKNIDKAVDSVERINDSKKLFKIAMKTKSFDVAKAAIEGINDEEKLFIIATQGNPNIDINDRVYVIEAASNKIIDPDKLFKIALPLTKYQMQRSLLLKSLLEKLISKSTELSERFVSEASDDDVRLLMLSMLKERNISFDYSHYNALVTEKLTNIDSASFVCAVELSNNLDLIETAYKSLCERKSSIRFPIIYDEYSIKAKAVKKRYEQLALEYVQATSDTYLLSRYIHRFSGLGDVTEVAKQKYISIKMPDSASQQMIFDIVLKDRLIWYDALQRLTDKTLLKQIALNETIDSDTRAKIAQKIDLDNPFGNRTFLCKKCNRAVVYREEFESIDSYQRDYWFECSGCRKACSVDLLADYFTVGEITDVNLRDSIIFCCPKCGKIHDGYKKKCNCLAGSIPVKAITDICF